MSFENGTGGRNRSEKLPDVVDASAPETPKKPKKVLKSFAELGDEKPKRGRAHKAERRAERQKVRDSLPRLRKEAHAFFDELDAEFERLVQRVGLNPRGASLDMQLPPPKGGRYYLEIRITDAELPNGYDVAKAERILMEHIRRDPRNPNISPTVTIRRKKDATGKNPNLAELEKKTKVPLHYNVEAHEKMFKREQEQRDTLFDKLQDQLVRDNFQPKPEGRELYFRVRKDAQQHDVFEVVCDNEEVPTSIAHTVERLAVIEPRLLAGSHVLVQKPDGSVVVQSREVGGRVEGKAARVGEAKESIDNAKVELFPRVRPRLKEFATAVGVLTGEKPEIGMLASVVSAQMTEALDDILRLEKSTGRRGKDQARTNMIGGTTLFNRLQTLGLIDEAAQAVNTDAMIAHLRDYLERGNDAERNFIIALYNISARFRKSDRGRAFPRTLPALEKKLEELGLSSAPAELPQAEKPEEPWRLALGIHPDADGEGMPQTIRRSLGMPTHPIITSGHAELLRDLDALRRIEGPEVDAGILDASDAIPSLEHFRDRAEELEKQMEALGSRTPGQAAAYIGELEYEVTILKDRLTASNKAQEDAVAEAEALRTELEASKEVPEEQAHHAVDLDAKVKKLTEEIQRNEARNAILSTLVTELERVAHDPEAVRTLASLGAEALRNIEE